MSTVVRSASEDELVDNLLDFLRGYYREEVLKLAEKYPKDQESLHIQYSDLEVADHKLADDFIQNPEIVQQAAQSALGLYDLPVDVDLSGANVRITGLPDRLVYDVGEYRVDNVVGTFAGIRGQVSRLSQQDLLITEAVFECARCGTIDRLYQPDPTNLHEPHECKGCERNGPFNELLEESTWMPFQKIRLQAPPEASRGRDRTIDVELRGDLVDNVTPGDRVIVNSRIQPRLKTKNGKPQPIGQVYGTAESIRRLETTFEDIEIDPHLERIEGIANGDNPVQDIIDSIAPSLLGYEDIKEALAYQMFGGIRKEVHDGSVRRGTSHILLVGDPGLGKSTLLQYAERLSPRAVYTTGKGSSAAGLTASAVKDDFGDGGWTLKAGAVVEAHKGLCAIDELDKMDEDDRGALMEAMSDQRISVSKAGINATLPAQTTILAGANPSKGRFDQHENIANQIDLDPALVSRFDLIFTMADRPDEEFDRQVAKHMNKVARSGQRLKRGESAEGEEVKPSIEPEVLRAYIALAREKCPVFTDAAMDVFEDEYVALRQANDDDGAIPTTARMVEALHRLAEASARIRLADEVTAEDVKRVLRIHRSCLEDVGVDPETGEFDVDIIESGSSRTQEARYEFVETVIREIAGKNGHASEAEVIDAGIEEGYNSGKIEHAIEKLRQRGDIYPHGDGYRPTS